MRKSVIVMAVVLLASALAAAQMAPRFQLMLSTADWLAALAQPCDVDLQRVGRAAIQEDACRTFMHAYLQYVDTLTTDDAVFAEAARAVDTAPTAEARDEMRQRLESFLHASDKVIHTAAEIRRLHAAEASAK